MSVHSQPYCPTCRRELQSRAIFVQDGVAFCHTHECHHSEKAATAIALIKHDPDKYRAFQSWGIFWWMPTNPDLSSLDVQLCLIHPPCENDPSLFSLTPPNERNPSSPIGRDYDEAAEANHESEQQRRK